MTDREKAGLRGPVQRVVSASFRADWQTKVMPEKPFSRDETVYLPDGRLLTTVYFNPEGSNWRTTNTYDADGRILEVRSSSGHEEQISRHSYDRQGRLARVTQTKGNAAESTVETYQYAPDGAKTRIRYIPPEAYGPNMGVDLRIEDSELSIPAQGAATLTTIYDRRGFPAEALAHGAQHELIARAIYVCDVQGRIVEEKMEPGHEPASGIADQFPEEVRELMVRVVASHFMHQRVICKYDDAGNRIEVKRDMGPLGSDTRRTHYDGHGNKILEESESVSRGGMDFDMNGNEVPQTAKTNEARGSVRFDYKYDDRGNWTEQVEWSSFEPDHKEFRSGIGKRAITYF
jgi:YD repeat-containing protein